MKSKKLKYVSTISPIKDRPEVASYLLQRSKMHDAKRNCCVCGTEVTKEMVPNSYFIDVEIPNHTSFIRDLICPECSTHYPDALRELDSLLLSYEESLMEYHDMLSVATQGTF